MSDFAKLQSGVLEGAMQSMLESRRRLREVESMIEGVIPLTENTDTEKKLEEIREVVAKAGGDLQRIYNRNAKEAFKA